MTSLRSLPTPPKDVRYALTVPQSVLFADLSLRGSTAPVFRRTLGIDYEPRYIAIDNGAMSWNFSPSDPFVAALASVAPSSATPDVVRQFIELMGRTSRYLTRQAHVLSVKARRRDSRD